MRPQDFSMWLLLALMWGSSFLFIAIAVHDVTPIEIVATRMVLGAALLLAVMVAMGRSLKLTRRDLITASVVGAMGNLVPFFLIGYAEQSVPSSVAALIMAISPIATLAIAPLIHPDEALTPLKLLGALFGLSAVVLLVGPGSLSGVGAQMIPQLALVGAALCYAFTALFTRFRAPSSPMLMATASVVIGALMAVGAMLVLPQPITLFSASTSASAWGAMAFLGLASTGLAAILYFQLIPRIGAGRLQQVNYVVPVVGAVLGVVILLEPVTWNMLASFPLIFLAMACLTKRTKNDSLD